MPLSSMKSDPRIDHGNGVNDGNGLNGSTGVSDTGDSKTFLQDWRALFVGIAKVIEAMRMIAHTL